MSDSLSEIDLKINKIIDEINKRKSDELAIKYKINAMYGVFGTPYFACYNKDIAEAVTSQGRDIITYASNIINDYFRFDFFKNKELHSNLGLDFKDDVYIKDFSDLNCIVYGDTDSIYFSINEFLKLLKNYNELNKNDLINVCLKIYKNCLSDYIELKLNEYAKSNNTKNVLSLSLQYISYGMLILKKKKYALNLAYKDPDIFYEYGNKIYITGIEIIQSSTPSFARKHLSELTNYIIVNNKKLDLKELNKKILDIKELFKLANIKDICVSKKITDYDKFIFDDVNSLSMSKGTPIHIRASAIYNYMLNSRHKSFKKKYNLIKSNDKVYFYYTKNLSDNYNVFGFLDDFPYEFAPEIDYDIQFNKVILSPIKRLLDVLNFDFNLSKYETSLF